MFSLIAHFIVLVLLYVVLTGILQSIAYALIEKPFSLNKGIKGQLSTALTIFLTLAQLWCYQTHSLYFSAYSLFFSALTITIFTDLNAFLISRYVTIYLVPAGWLLSNFDMLPIDPLESIFGSLFGLFILLFVRFFSKRFLGKEGLGQGDIDLLSFIGAFTGPFGCWTSMMIGSLSACAVAIPYALITKKRDFKLPFGVFLALGAIGFVIFHEQIAALLMPQ